MKGLRACLTNNKNQLKNRQRCFKNGQKKQARSSQREKKKSTGNKISRVNQHKQMKLKKRFKNQRKGRGQQMLQRKKKMKCAPRRQGGQEIKGKYKQIHKTQHIIKH